MFRYLLDCLRAGALTPAGTAAAVFLFVTATPAWGLGLGDISLDSSLNEPLDASIELYDVQGLQPAEIMVSLAKAQDFQRVGVERFFFLTDLRFEVVHGAGGARTIRVRSGQPITEPYVNFLIEVLWPSGRMLKEYTLLLDPPTFTPAPAPTVAAPASRPQAAADAGRVERSAGTVTSGTQVTMPAGRPSSQASPLDEGVVGGEYRMTDRNDTLWSIASRTRPSRAVSVNQNMLALQRLNPDAFLHGNINLLKAGYTLRLPSESEALAIDDGQATALVAAHNDNWLAMRRGDVSGAEAAQRLAAAEDRPAAGLPSTVDATPARATSQRAATEPGGELRIVATAGDGIAGGGVAAAADERLAITLEEQDRLAREVEELTSVLARERELASNQLAVRDRQIEVRDQQLAQMQAEMERLRQEVAATAQSQNQSASNSPQAWWQSPYVLGGAGGLVVLLLAFGLIGARRRSDAPAASHAEPRIAARSGRSRGVAGAAATVSAAPAVAIAEAVAEADHLEVEPAEEEVQDAPVAAEVRQDSPHREDVHTGAETSDVIGEADIYIAYGRYAQAIGLLSGVLADEPHRNDVRLRLLELYAETDERDDFERHLAEFQEHCRDDEMLLTARELGRRFEAPETAEAVVDVGEDLTADDFAGDVDAGELPALDFVASDRNADASIDGESDAAVLEESGELELVELDDVAFERAPTATVNGSGHDEAEFELELDETDDDPQAPVRLARAAPDDLGGDLGIEFDPDRAAPGEQRAAAPDAGSASDGDFELDLDVDLDAELADIAVGGDDDFGFEDEGDTTSTKLDLARAYIDMGDQDGARDILNEVVAEGNAEQQRRAEAMLEEL